MTAAPPTVELSHVDVRALPDGENFKLLAPVIWRYNDVTVKVPEGFVTDFASVPRAFWWLFPPYGKYTGAAVIHDYLYWSHDQSRAMADAVFLAAMKHLGVPAWTRRTMYLAVRAFGRGPYSKGV